MKHRRTAAIGIALVLALLLIGVTGAQGSYHLQRQVVSGGGGPVNSTHYTLHSTAGQGITGQAASPGYRLSAGYWHGPLAPSGVSYRIYLPLILRNYP